MPVLYITCRSSGTHLRCSYVPLFVVRNCTELKVYCKNRLTAARDEMENCTQYSTHAQTHTHATQRFHKSDFFLSKKENRLESFWTHIQLRN
jgi:hypothetical protein